MKRATLVAVIGVGLLTALAAPAEAQTKITEQEAHLDMKTPPKVPRCLLLTQSGHERPKVAAVQTDP
jgi:hypothetical protein